MKIENEKLFTLLVYERTAKNGTLVADEDAEHSLSKSAKTVNGLADSESR